MYAGVIVTEIEKQHIPGCYGIFAFSGRKDSVGRFVIIAVVLEQTAH